MDPGNILQIQYPEPPAPPARTIYPDQLYLQQELLCIMLLFMVNSLYQYLLLNLAVLPSEDYAVFERQFRSSIGLSAVPNGRRHNFLHLRLQEGALQFYEQLPNAV